MTEVKVSGASGAVLDWMVAKCEDTGKRRLQPDEFPLLQREGRYLYSTDWAQGGPIIDREKIGSLHEARGVWSASTKWEDPAKVFYGKTKLIAAMRCYVASKLGDTVDVPEELPV